VVTFIVYVAAKRSLSFLYSRRPKLQLIRAGALFIATSYFYVAITKMQLADAAAIQFLAPVLVTAFLAYS
jgi:drug/metabolite transporter (DMT)-like permease